MTEGHKIEEELNFSDPEQVRRMLTGGFADVPDEQVALDVAAHPEILNAYLESMS